MKLPLKNWSNYLTKTMILYAEHGFNASTFAARVIASTNSDVGSAVTGAIGALKGTFAWWGQREGDGDDERD